MIATGGQEQAEKLTLNKGVGVAQKLKTMKKLFTILIGLLFANVMFSQQNEYLVPMDISGECAVPILEKQINFTPTQLNNAKMAVSGENYFFNVKVHYLDNIIDPSEQEMKALDIVGILNYKFNNNGIFFKYRGYDNTNSDSNYDYSIIGDDANELYYLKDYVATDQNIDIFICNGFPNQYTTGVTWSWSYPSSGLVADKIIFLRFDYIPIFNNASPTNADMKYQTLPHEMGHYLGLYHPHQRWKYDSNGNLITVGDSYQGCDAIEENLDGSEATIYGDLLADTNPDRVKSRYNLGYYTNCSLNWSGYHDDACGNHIDQNLFNPSMDNVMAYYHYCRAGFSPEQKDRMRAFINQYNSGGFLTNELTTVESLYEPYETANPVPYQILYTSQQDLAPGVPLYQTYYHYKNKFQKGFDYDFYAYEPNPNSSNIIFTYLFSKQIFERPVTDETHLGIRINQIGTDVVIYENRPNPVPGPTVTSSTIISSDINTNNQTTRNLNEQEANDPNLYQNLESQKLHIIIKNLDNGEQDVKQIIKD